MTAELDKDSRERIERVRDEYLDQIPSHSGYVMAAIFGLVLSLSNLLSNQYYFGIVALLVFIFGAYAFSRLIYYSELLSITSDLLGLNGEERVAYFIKKFNKETDILELGGIYVVFREFEARRNGKGLYEYGPLRKVLLDVSSAFRELSTAKIIEMSVQPKG